MNKERLSRIHQAKSILDSCLEEEQEYKENLPESLANASTGERADTAISALESAIDSLEEIE